MPPVTSLLLFYLFTSLCPHRLFPFSHPPHLVFGSFHPSLTEVSKNLFARYSACPVEIFELAGDVFIQVTQVLSLRKLFAGTRYITQDAFQLQDDLGVDRSSWVLVTPRGHLHRNVCRNLVFKAVPQRIWNFLSELMFVLNIKATFKYLITKSPKSSVPSQVSAEGYDLPPICMLCKCTRTG